MPYIIPAELVGLGFDTSTIPPEDLDAICSRASLMVDNEAQQVFEKTQTDEVQPVLMSGDMVKVFPANLPIISVEGVRLFLGAGRVADLDPAQIMINNEGGYFWTWERLAFVGSQVAAKVSYTHGYEVIPAVVVEAVKLTAKVLLGDYMATKMTGMAGVKMVMDGTRKVETTTVLEVPKAAKDILNNLKRVR